VSSARAQGIDVELISANEAGGLWPLMETKDLLGGIWLPGDGKANPTDLTQSLASGARAGGAQIIERIRVTVKNGAVSGVATANGEIKADIVVNCAGQWARNIGNMCNVSVPMHSAEHMYIVTGQIEGVSTNLPVLRDPDGFIYFKEEVGGLAMGGFEPDAKPWGMHGIPDDFEYSLLPDDWDQFEILMQNALIRVPQIENDDIKNFYNGPESFTPDNNFLLVEAPELRNFFVGAGFNSMGIASAGGAGKALAEWIVNGAPTMDLWSVDIVDLQALTTIHVGCMIESKKRWGLCGLIWMPPYCQMISSDEELITEGFVSLLEPLIDTVVICKMTALVITISVNSLSIQKPSCRC
jgi:glycine/D-amino acid oxidase-like deaminating enzyme